MKQTDFLLFFFVIMLVCIPPVCAIQHDGIFKYDAGDSVKAKGTFGLKPWGYAVLFNNTDTVTITGIQVYGCKFGTGNKTILIEIWDRDLKRLYQDSVVLDEIPFGQMDVDKNNCGAVASWAEIPLPNHVVTGDFYAVVFTYSPKPSKDEQGMSIGFTQPSMTATSHTVKKDPNQIDEITIVKKYIPSDIDWMIRTLYIKSNETATSTDVPGLTQQNAQTTTATTPAVHSPSMDQTSAAQTVKTENTKASIGVDLVVISVMISMLLWRRH